jgi:hypothetical protein
VDTKQKRFLFTVGFKLHAIDYAKEHGNRAHKICFLSQLRTVKEARGNYRNYRRAI